MKKKLLALWMALLLGFWTPAAVWAQSGGNCSIFRSWITGDSLTAGDLTSSFTTVGVTNMTQACIDGISDTVAGMQTTTDPYASETESLATSGAGELQRLRFVLGRVFGFSQWYKHTENINFGGIGQTKTNVQGSGFGQHVTAVGLHTWSGSQRFPIFTSTNSHTTGFFWPAAHHLAIAIDPANEADKAGVEMFRFHAQGMTLHHTAAIMFRHSAAWNPQWQYPHITAISLSRGLVSAAGNEAAGRDTLLFGHASAVINLVGYGASHIALGQQGYIALGMHSASAIGTPVSNALYGANIIKAWGSITVTGSAAVLTDGFNISGVGRIDTGDFRVFWTRGFSDSSYGVLITSVGSVARIGTIETIGAAHVGVRLWTAADTPTPVDTQFSILAIGRQ